MNRHAHTIKNTHRREIEIMKGYIRQGARPFMVEKGYIFQTARKELKAEGIVLHFNRETGNYEKERK